MKNLGKISVWLAILSLVSFVVILVSPRILYPIRYDHEIVKAEETHRVSRNLLLAVMREESHFDPQSSSRSQAQGLMQLLPSTSQWIAEKRKVPYDPSQIRRPEINIDFGAWYLAYLGNQLQDETLAIEAYNAGITNVLEWQKKQQGFVGFAETDYFVKQVKQSKTQYDRIYGQKWEKR